MTDATERLRRDYASAFLAYLMRRDETRLREAYELGRRAMTNEVSLLDLVQVHHTVLLDALANTRDAQELQDVARAAAALLVEALSSYEMGRRAFLEKTAERRSPNAR